MTVPETGGAATWRHVVVVGAGAVGSWVAGHLSGTTEVTLVDGWFEHLEAIRHGGLRLEHGHDVSVRAVSTLHVHECQQLYQRAPDLVLLCVKSYDTAWATQLVAPYLAATGAVVSLQNGINEDAIARIVGWGRVLGCVVSGIAVNAIAPGRVVRSVEADAADGTVFQVGELHGRITPRVEQIVATLSKVHSAAGTTNLWGQRWSKLVLNSMINGVCAVTGRNVRDCLQDPVAQRAMLGIAAEAVRVGQALGFDIASVGGTPPDVILDAASGRPAAWEAFVAGLNRLAARMRADASPSTAQDLAKGRHTEVESLNGYIASAASTLDVHAPFNTTIQLLVRDIEARRRTPSDKLLAELRAG